MTARDWVRAGGALALTAALAACAGKPDWVMKGSGAFKRDQKVFYGVGIAEGIQSENLRRNTADNRAIAEIAKQLSTISTSLMRDYAASTAVPAEQKADEDQYVENTVKTFTSNAVSGVRIVDRYQAKDGALYSLASMNLDELKTLAGEAKELNASVRDYIKANADSAFDKLSEEEAKRAGTPQ